MLTLHEAYIDAILADAAYVDGMKELSAPGLAARLSGRMTPSVAKYISENYTVVDQVGGLDASFDAVIWKENSTGKLIVAMRGTQQGEDFAVDADLAFTGYARAQVIDMVNWWFKVNTPVGQVARQIAIQTVIVGYIPGTDVLITQDNYIDMAGIPASGKVIADALAIGTELVGHSLGGYAYRTETLRLLNYRNAAASTKHLQLDGGHSKATQCERLTH